MRLQVEERLAKQAREAGGSFERGELSLSSSRQEEMLTEDVGVPLGEAEPEEEAVSDAPDSIIGGGQPSDSERVVRTPGDHTEL